jgi:hypothetical protein
MRERMVLWIGTLLKLKLKIESNHGNISIHQGVIVVRRIET